MLSPTLFTLPDLPDLPALTLPDLPDLPDPIRLERLIKEHNVKTLKLKRKSELARLSRKRKKAQLIFLEEKAHLLEEENKQLRQNLIELKLISKRFEFAKSVLQDDHVGSLNSTGWPVVDFVDSIRWLCSQNTSFYNDENGLWHYLLNELDLPLYNVLKDLHEDATIIKNLMANLQKSRNNFEKIMADSFKNRLNKQQYTKFCIWVEKYGGKIALIN